jgi:NagD protein
VKATHERGKSVKGYLIDMDGVIYRGSEPIPGAAEFLQTLQENGIPYLLLTNNSAYTPRDAVVKLKHLGIQTSEEHVYTSALATAEFVHQQRPGGTAFVIGEGGLLAALHDVGYAINRDNPDYVIVGEGRVLNYELVEHAHRLLCKGALLLSTNSDAWCPTDSGPRPGCGAIVALLETASGRKAYHIGKPNPFMMRAARKRLGLRSGEVVMIGDTMETDIRGAAELGFQSILVLTGSSTLESLREYPYSPTRIVSSIADLALEADAPAAAAVREKAA